MGGSGDARFCVSTEEVCDDRREVIDITYWHGLDGRRKILRLYFRGASIINTVYLYIKIMAPACRDAKSCVSRGRDELADGMILISYTAMGWTGDARFCVSTGGNKQY